MKVQGAWSGGCKRPVEMGGAVFVVVALTPYGGWHKEAKEWTDRVAHTGDKVPHDAWDERASGEDVGVGLATERIIKWSDE
jgi:hypothetical protein